MAYRRRSLRRGVWLAVCVTVTAAMVSGLQPSAQAAAPAPAQLSLRAGDVPSFSPVDPSIETFQDPNDQGLDQAFIHCVGSTPLLREFDSGPQATVSQVFGQGSDQFGTPSLAIGSAVFSDGSVADATTAYGTLASSSLQRCWASTQDSLNAQQGVTTPIRPSTVSPLPSPPYGSAATAFAINVDYSALGTPIRGQFGISVVQSSEYVVMVITTAYDTQFPTSVSTSALGKLVGRIPTPAPVHVDTVVFVHGINSGCDEPGLPGDRPAPSGPLSYQALYQQLVGGGSGVYTFCYDHDLAFSRNSGANWARDRCFSSTTSHGPDVDQTIAFDANTTPLYASQPASAAQASSYNDTLGPLAYDATKLDDCLQALVAYDKAHSSSGGIAVVGNSMGGAITRGWLQLAQYRHSSALDAVTTVVLLEAATEGSQIALAGTGLSNAIGGLGGPVLGTMVDAAAEAIAANFHFGRAGEVGVAPGIEDLAPGSTWYQSIIAAGAPPPALHYFTFSVGVQFAEQVQYFFWSDTQVFTPLGDGVMQLGDPDPEASPFAGGSEFLPGGDSQDRHQYVILTTPDPLPPLNLSLGPVIAALGAGTDTAAIVQGILSDPYSHFNFGNHIGTDTTVASCGSGHRTITIPAEIGRILDDPTQACQ